MVRIRGHLPSELQNWIVIQRFLTCQEAVKRGIITRIMRDYEFMLVLVPDFDHSDTKKQNDIVKKILSTQKVTVKSIDDWGKKKLAYPIQKKEEGVYLLAHLEAESLQVGAIEKQCRLDENVLRYLLTVREERKQVSH